MKLSKVLTIVLFGTVGFTTTAMAQGTIAGTKITNQPLLEYSFGGVKKKTKAPVASYIVDKVINFTITRSEAQEHKVVAGTTKIVEFKLTNIGNSIENFKLSKWHNEQNVKFLSKKFFVDANGNGILDEKEKVDSALIKKLAIDGFKKIWMELQIDPKAVVKKRSDSGILAEAVNALSKPYVASTKNRMDVKDIVFADGQVYAPIDKLRDGKMSMWYGFTIIENANNIKLDMNLVHNDITADPVNGICKDYKDAKSGKYKAIPGATNVRAWLIENKTKETAKNVKFSVRLDPKVEKVATNSKKTWWKDDKRVHIIWTPKGTVGEGKYNSATNSIDFMIPEIKKGEKYYPYVVTEIK